MGGRHRPDASCGVQDGLGGEDAASELRVDGSGRALPALLDPLGFQGDGGDWAARNGANC
jgi:hypothetical protein